MEALELLQKNTGVNERAVNYVESIKRNLERDLLDKLYSKRDALIDSIFEQKDFSLVSDKNANVLALTRQECEDRFKSIIEAEYQLELLTREIKIKEKSFNKYFKEKVKE